MAHLVAIAGPSAGKRYELDKECVLGRSFNSDVYVGDLNVSRRHARIIVEGGGFLIEDLGSGNGTFVNEQQITRKVLREQDVIRVGGSSFRYEQQEKNRWGEDVQTVIADLIDRVPTGEAVASLSIAPSSAVSAIARQPMEALTDKRAIKMLESMYAVADAIAIELDLDKLLIKILDHLFDVFPQAERGFVLMVNEKTGQLVPEAVKQRHGRQGGFSFSQTMVDQVMEGGKGVIRGNTIPSTRPAKPVPATTPPPAQSPLAMPASKSSATPKMGAPLRCRNEMLGTLHLEGQIDASPFSQDDLALLSAIARQAAVAIANARTGQALLVQQRLEADLQLARKIQQSFLPSRLPEVEGLVFHTHYLPALNVGGDFYDIIQLAESRIGILVGDISGKGVSAALLMAKLTSDIRYLSRASTNPAEILNRANVELIQAEQDAMFATVLYLMLDLAAHTFTVANAGHQPPMVCSGRFEGISELDDATGVALGVVPDMVYAQEVYELVAGDVVLLYTDGINEAMNRSNQEYGIQRQRSAVLAGPAEPSLVVQRVVADVRRFVGNSPQSDDQTLLAFGLLNRSDHTGPIRL